MNFMKKNLVVIGYGGMGTWHTQHALKSDVVNLAGVYDINPEKNKLAEERGIFAYDSYEAVLADEKVDLITVAIPNDSHKEVVIRALEAGKNVICEKPVSMDSAELDEMIAASEKSGKLFSVHQNRRFDVDFLAMKQIKQSGELGELINIESRIHGSRGIPSDWRGEKEHGGGMLLDWGVHLIDQILFMMPSAKIKSVYADIKNVLHEEVDDYFKIILKMDNGITAHIELSTYILEYQPRWLVAGDKGTLIVKNFGCEGNIYRTGKMLEKLPPQITETEAGPTRQFAPVPPGGIITEKLPEIETDWVDFYRNVIDVLNGRAESLIKISEVRRVLAVMQAAWESANTNKAILFE